MFEEVLQYTSLFMNLNDENEKLLYRCEKMTDYYEFEQFKVRNSIQDIENHYFQTIDTEMKHHLHEFNYGHSIKVKNFPNPELIDWIKNLLIAFSVYNTQSINEIELFLKINSELKNEINEVLDNK